MKNFGGLDEAIANFNDWNRAAVLYVNIHEGYFETIVFHNDVEKAETVFTDGVYGIFNKEERGDRKIGDKEKNYILDYTRLIIDGYTPTQADYKLMDDYAFM